LLIVFESGILSKTAYSRDKYWNKKKSLHERSILMLLSTLPDIPGRTYDVIGVVFGRADIGIGKYLGGKKATDLEDMFQDMVQQASRMGADAIIDIKMPAVGGEHPVVAAIGTAVKLR
jgi:uncharacterized protein YbjQ (UPF0145 family)